MAEAPITPSLTGGEAVTLANWRRPPFNRWGFQHVREIVPSADIPNDPDGVWELPAFPVAIGGLPVTHDGEVLRFDDVLGRTDTDGLVVLHRGRVVCEYYANGMTAETPHILMSVSKSILGVLAGILADRGVLRLDALAREWVPELAVTAYGEATLRDLLDMRTGVRFDEDYEATSGPMLAYRKAQGWHPADPADPPSDLRNFCLSLTDRDGLHGGRFHYVSPNTDLLGWILERASGMRYADLASMLLWRPMGAERSAYITVDRLGAARSAGGFCATVRDLARLGQLLAERGRRGDVQVIPAGWINDVLANGDAGAWAAGNFAAFFPGLPIRYRSKWYVLGEEAPVMFCFGVNGQHLFVDTEQAIVVAKVSSQQQPMNPKQILLTFALVHALRTHLNEHPSML